MTVYINPHVQEQFNKRANAHENLDLKPISRMIVLVQREKNGLKINALKGCIKLENGLYLIVNIYKNIKTEKLTMKALTVLTHKQLQLSRNFGKGNYLKKMYDIKTQEVLFEDKFFDYNTYTDFFKSIEWTEEDVLHNTF